HRERGLRELELEILVDRVLELGLQPIAAIVLGIGLAHAPSRNRMNDRSAESLQYHGEPTITQLSSLPGQMAVVEKGEDDSMDTGREVVVTRPKNRVPELVSVYDRVALVLQGGGALGAYQAGVYHAL